MIRRLVVSKFSCKRNITSQFYKVAPEFANDSQSQQAFLTPKVMEFTTDLSKVRPGEVIEVPYEFTISHSFRDFWQSANYSHDRINTSKLF